MSATGWTKVWQEIDSLVRFGMKPGLERMHALLDRLDHPERAFRAIRIAGSNGKGTTAFLLAGLLKESGLRTGLYTSPHVLHPGERIRVNGITPDEDQLGRAWAILEPHTRELESSYFEALTALALLLFRDTGVEIAVLECGLGARYDATAVVPAELGILSSISADHMEVLGPTLADVARDKAHVADFGNRLLSAVEDRQIADAVAEVCRERMVELIVADVNGDRESVIYGRHGSTISLPIASQGWTRSARLAMRAFDLLEVDKPAGAGVTLNPGRDTWLARCQLLNEDPPLVLDTAHNPAALAFVVDDLRVLFPHTRFDVLLTGMREKDLVGNLRALSSLGGELRVWLPEGHGRAAGRKDWEAASKASGVSIDYLPDADLEGYRDTWPAGADHGLLVTGSFLIAARWLGADRLPPGL
jgi:dihydrofolate synthase/folylpolyglutamate synthase